MGIDLGDKRVRSKKVRTEPRSKNPYLALLVKLYSFLARRTNSRFNQVVLKRLLKSRKNRCLVGLRKLDRCMENKEHLTAVVCTTVTNDLRLYNVRKMDVCALRFTEAARKRIEQAGGSCMTFDEFAMKNPTGANSVLLRGSIHAREAAKHFGRAPGLPKSKAKPYITGKSAVQTTKRKENARGRRRSCGFKN
jgi:large subunit ribosomal protein L18e